jgi:hypothetical protein
VNAVRCTVDYSNCYLGRRLTPALLPVTDPELGSIVTRSHGPRDPCNDAIRARNCSPRSRIRATAALFARGGSSRLRPRFLPGSVPKAGEPIRLDELSIEAASDAVLEPRAAAMNVPGLPPERVGATGGIVRLHAVVRVAASRAGRRFRNPCEPRRRGRDGQGRAAGALPRARSAAGVRPRGAAHISASTAQAPTARGSSSWCSFRIDAAIFPPRGLTG